MSEVVNLYKYEEELEDNGLKYICGVDEVGRGCIAGPVVVSAVILPINLRIKGLNDSKKLSAKKREELFQVISKNALAISTIFIPEDEIEQLNIYQATKKGMIDAIADLKIEPQHALIDAMKIAELKIPNTSIIRGDMHSASIAAASIIAKVTRDDFMSKMDIKYPNYGFKQHKGYCTKKHVENLEALGPCEIHRKSFYPVTKYYNKQLKFEF